MAGVVVGVDGVGGRGCVLLAVVGGGVLGRAEVDEIGGRGVVVGTLGVLPEVADEQPVSALATSAATPRIRPTDTGARLRSRSRVGFPARREIVTPT